MIPNHRSGYPGVFDASSRKTTNSTAGNYANNYNRQPRTYDQTNGHYQQVYQQPQVVYQQQNYQHGGYQQGGYQGHQQQQYQQQYQYQPWNQRQPCTEFVEVIEYIDLPVNEHNQYQQQTAGHSRNILDRVSYSQPVQSVGNYNDYINDQKRGKNQSYNQNNGGYYHRDYSTSNHHTSSSSRGDHARYHYDGQGQQRSQYRPGYLRGSERKTAPIARENGTEEVPARIRSPAKSPLELNKMLNQMNLSKQGTSRNEANRLDEVFNPKLELLYQKLKDKLEVITGDAKDKVPKSSKSWTEVGFSSFAEKLVELGMPMEYFHKKLMMQYMAHVASIFPMFGFVDIGVLTYVTVMLAEKLNRTRDGPIRMIVVADEDYLLKDISTVFRYLGYNSTLINGRYDTLRKPNTPIVLVKPHVLNEMASEEFPNLSFIWVLTSDSMKPNQEMEMMQFYKTFTFKHLSNKAPRSAQIKVFLNTTEENRVLIDCVTKAETNFNSSDDAPGFRFVREEDGHMQICVSPKTCGKEENKKPLPEKLNYLDTSNQEDEIAIEPEVMALSETLSTTSPSESPNNESTPPTPEKPSPNAGALFSFSEPPPNFKQKDNEANGK
ncbi:unnamed protein product, partial [Mesorhabditis belari]|uniref:Uncharacterized protein n=1 Tax=Mesorhabditis belari TaxID=2138241 RepID=A0AAF3E9J7_9BILA